MAAITARLKEVFPDAIIGEHEFRGDETIIVTRESIIPIITLLRDATDTAFTILVDMTAVDYSEYPGREDGPRFEVVYHFLSLQNKKRLRIKVAVSEEDCWVPTATGLYAIADWQEREIWDLMGIVFKDHPNLKRIMMYEEFQGHPLRKDYPYNREQPLFEPREPYKSAAGTPVEATIREGVIKND